MQKKNSAEKRKKIKERERGLFCSKFSVQYTNSLPGAFFLVDSAPKNGICSFAVK